MTLQEQLRKKVAFYRSEADRMTHEGDNADDNESRVWCYGHSERFAYCADDLESILISADETTLLNAEQQAGVAQPWTDEQCLQFASVAFRHAPKNLPVGVTLDDIRMAAARVESTAQTSDARDAARYRWLRDPPMVNPLPAWIAGQGNKHIESDWLTGEQADAVIDTAMEAK